MDALQRRGQDHYLRVSQLYVALAEDDQRLHYELGSRGSFPQGWLPLAGGEPLPGRTGLSHLEGVFVYVYECGCVCVLICVYVLVCVCLHRGVVQLGGSRPFRLVLVAGAPGVPVPIGWLGWA